LSPPPTPRVERSKPAATRRLTSFCTVGAGRPVSCASSRAHCARWVPSAHMCARDPHGARRPSSPQRHNRPCWTDA
jgi:hypothetical protein